MSEQKYKLGAIPSPIDLRDYRIAKAIDESQFPDEFEISMPHVKNQMQVCSCVAHALSEVVEYFNSQQEDNNKIMSTGYIYGNRTNMTHKGEGMVIRDALSNLQKYGDVTAYEFPWNIEVPEAIEAYEKALELNEYDTSTRVLLANTYYMDEKIEDALSAYRYVSNLEPENDEYKLVYINLLEDYIIEHRAGELLENV